MKKILKIILIIIGSVALLISIDIGSVLLRSKPVFAISNTNKDNENNKIYYGLLYDTYNCQDYKTSQIKFKWSNFSCPFTAKTNETDGNGWYNGISKFDFYISKTEVHNYIKFNDYYKTNERTIYLVSNINEFYILDEESEETLKKYISNTHQTIDDSIKLITDQLTKISVFRDGGTSIFKSKEKDISMIICNTVDGNKNIYIGDYLMEYEQYMCK